MEIILTEPEQTELQELTEAEAESDYWDDKKLFELLEDLGMNVSINDDNAAKHLIFGRKLLNDDVFWQDLCAKDPEGYQKRTKLLSLLSKSAIAGTLRTYEKDMATIFTESEESEAEKLKVDTKINLEESKKILQLLKELGCDIAGLSSSAKVLIFVRKLVNSDAFWQDFCAKDPEGYQKRIWLFSLLEKHKIKNTIRSPKELLLNFDEEGAA